MWIGDGGGVKPATARPVVGADKVARGLTSLVSKFISRQWRIETAIINNAPGILVWNGNELDAAYSFLGTDTHITHVLTIRNPHKLKGTGTALRSDADITPRAR